MGVFQETSGHRKGLWLFKFMLNGRQHKRVNFRTKREALAAEAALRRELARPETPGPTVTAFSGICESYLDFCQGRFTQNTIRQKAFVYRSLVGFIGFDFDAATLTAETVEAYLAKAHEARGPKAANRYLRDLKALYHWASRRGIVSAAELLKVVAYPEDRPRKYVPTVEDFNRVLLQAMGDDRDLLLVLYHTAARRGEILERLTWDDVNFDGRFVRLHTRKRRGGNLDGRTIPMNQTLHDVLRRRWISRIESPFVFPGCQSRESKKRLMRDLCAKAGVKPFGLHAIRHMVSTVLADGGKATPRQIQALLGHQRFETTEKYLHELAAVGGITDALDGDVKNQIGSRGSSRPEADPEKGTKKGLKQSA